MSKFDGLDRSIIAFLNRDARMPSAEIARQLGQSERTIHHRIQRLIKLNAIRPVAVINPAAFGYALAVDFFCELQVGYQERAVEAILQMPEVTYVAISTGDQDISVQAIFRDSEEINEFITRKLPLIPGMQRTRTVLIPGIIKDSYQWIPPAEAFDR